MIVLSFNSRRIHPKSPYHRAGYRFDTREGYSYTVAVFVAIACEFVNEEHKTDVYNLLKQYGFSRVTGEMFESVSFRSEMLPRLKRDIDRRTDFYDKVRMYQYPLDGVLVVTSLSDKKWRKTIMRS